MERPRTTYLILLTLSVTVSIALAKVPAVIVFGDSTVDTGNNNQILTILQSNFPPYGRDFFEGKATGRFSNGRLPPDFISEAFGLRPFVPAYLDPTYNISDFASGVCFASAGTGYDNATSNILNVIPLWEELENYKEYQKKLRAYGGTKKANKIIRESLYLISIGTNDFLENYYTIPLGRSCQYTIEEYQDFLVSIAKVFIKQLYSLGARKISLGGLPPMGCLPLERVVDFGGANGGCVQKYNDVAMNFNKKLAGLVKNLNKELSGLNLVFSNPYFTLMKIIRKPSSYGMEKTSKACCGTGFFEMGYLCNQLNPFTCSNANKYVFWDSFHPTQKTNQIISNRLVKTTLKRFL